MKSIVNVSVCSGQRTDDIEEAIEKEDKEYRDEKIKSGDNASQSDTDIESEDEEETTSSKSNKNSVRYIKLKEISKRYDVLLKNFNDANASNSALHDAFNSIIKNLQILSMPLNELSERLPAIQPINDDESKQIRDKLISLLAKVEEMKTQREQLLKRFQAAIQEDDITKMIASKQNEISSPNDFFGEQLKKHDQLVVYLQQNLQAQDNILRALAESNALFASDRKKILDATQQRNTYIDSLVFSYQSINDLIEKANKGVVFFQNLNQPLNELLKDAQDFCAKAQLERENKKKIVEKFNLGHNNGPQLAQLPQAPMPVFNRYRPQQIPQSNPVARNDQQLENNLNMMNLNVNPVNDRPKLKDFLPFMKPQSWGNNASKSTGPPTVDRSNHNTMPILPQSNQLGQNQAFSSAPSIQPHTMSQSHSVPNPIMNNQQPPFSPSVGNNQMPQSSPMPENTQVFAQQSFQKTYPNQYSNQQQLPFDQTVNYASYTKPEAKKLPNTQSTPPQLQPAQQFQSQSYQQVQAHLPPHIMSNSPLAMNSMNQSNQFYQQPQPDQTTPPPKQHPQYNHAVSNQPQSAQQISYQNQLMFQQQQQQMKLKEQEELNQMKLNQQKQFEQKQLEQQLKEREIQLKKQELEQREQELKLQQQQFFLQQQQKQQKLLLQEQKQNFLPQQSQMLQNFFPVSASLPNMIQSGPLIVSKRLFLINSLKKILFIIS